MRCIPSSDPFGLPKLAFSALGGSEFLPLIPLALTISFLGFLKSVSVAKTLASKRQQNVESNQSDSDGLREALVRIALVDARLRRTKKGFLTSTE